MIDWERLELEVADAGRSDKIADRIVTSARRRQVLRRAALVGGCTAVLAAAVAVPLLAGSAAGAGAQAAGMQVTSGRHAQHPSAPSIRAQIYAAALAGGPNPQPLQHRVYVRDHMCEAIPDQPGRACEGEAIPAAVARDVAQLLGPQVRFVVSAPWPKQLGDPTVVAFGRLTVDGERAEVGMEVLCGPLCGEGETLVLRRHDGQWQVSGTTGPQWIS